MFYFDEIIFSVTTKCNLNCKHCFVRRNNHTLDIDECKKLIDSCIQYNNNNCNLQRIGFSGGEPFLRLDFICEISKYTVNNDLLFDRLMTNGVWWKTENELTEALQKLYDSGFDGKFGLSYDSFHNQDTSKIYTFMHHVYKIFNCVDCIEILWVCPLFDKEQKKLDKLCSKKFYQIQKKLCKEFGKINLKIFKFNQSFEYNPENKLNSSDINNEFLSIDLNKKTSQNSLLSSSFSHTSPLWKDKKWFKDDFCQNTGNILYVHSNGNIAPCCGFANENKELFIGTIKDDATTLIKNANNNKMIHNCFVKGLGTLQKELKEKGVIFPGVTKDMCLFCDYLCKSKNY